MFPTHMNWTNMMSSKGQVYAEKKPVDFISKKEGPVYFEEHCIRKRNSRFNSSLTRGIFVLSNIKMIFAQLSPRWA